MKANPIQCTFSQQSLASAGGFTTEGMPWHFLHVQIARRSGHDLSAKTTSLWGFNIPSLEESIGGSRGGGSLQATKWRKNLLDLLRWRLWYTSSLYRSEADWIIWNGQWPCHLWRCSCRSRHRRGRTSWKIPAPKVAELQICSTQEWQKCNLVQAVGLKAQTIGGGSHGCCQWRQGHPAQNTWDVEAPESNVLLYYIPSPQCTELARSWETEMLSLRKSHKYRHSHRV